MNTKGYIFEDFTDKDMFECKLAGKRPEFGYVSIRNRRTFIDFLVKKGFLEDRGTVKSRLETHSDSKTLIDRYKEFQSQYKVLYSFKYAEMRDYAPGVKKIHEGQDVFTYKSWQIVAMQL